MVITVAFSSFPDDVRWAIDNATITLTDLRSFRDGVKPLKQQFADMTAHRDPLARQLQALEVVGYQATSVVNIMGVLSGVTWALAPLTASAPALEQQVSDAIVRLSSESAGTTPAKSMQALRSLLATAITNVSDVISLLHSVDDLPSDFGSGANASLSGLVALLTADSSAFSVVVPVAAAAQRVHAAAATASVRSCPLSTQLASLNASGHAALEYLRSKTVLDVDALLSNVVEAEKHVVALVSAWSAMRAAAASKSLTPTRVAALSDMLEAMEASLVAIDERVQPWTSALALAASDPDMLLHFPQLRTLAEDVSPATGAIKALNDSMTYNATVGAENLTDWISSMYEINETETRSTLRDGVTDGSLMSYLQPGPLRLQFAADYAQLLDVLVSGQMVANMTASPIRTLIVNGSATAGLRAQLNAAISNGTMDEAVLAASAFGKLYASDKAGTVALKLRTDIQSLVDGLNTTHTLYANVQLALSTVVDELVAQGLIEWLPPGIGVFDLADSIYDGLLLKSVKDGSLSNNLHSSPFAAVVEALLPGHVYIAQLVRVSTETIAQSEGINDLVATGTEVQPYGVAV
jgi:hypothetical protein